MGHSRALAIEHIKVKRNEVLLADVCGVCLLAGAGEGVALVPTVIGLCKACERGAAPERARERERERERATDGSKKWAQKAAQKVMQGSMRVRAAAQSNRVVVTSSSGRTSRARRAWHASLRC